VNINDLELTNKTLVIVEDDLPTIKYYEILLKNTGANIHIFKTGKDFLDFIAQGNNNIDFIFIDFLIPLVNGIDCIKMFRKENRNTPIIMLTAYSSEQAKTEAYIAGCNEYVLKPVYPEKIFFLIGKYLKTEASVHVNY
jgi:CheY-like chemotaxis protein